MNRIARLAAAGALAATITTVAGATAAEAKDGDVIVEGDCSAASDWKLKLSEENGALEVEFEVDSNRVGEVWNFSLKRNGETVATGSRRTLAPSGSFEVRRVISDANGVADTVVGRATNRLTGEVCTGRATSNF